ncbi:hypothetical protein BGX31_008760 [Mortierella sp. GBA43]|nr:hypothetical protein BGX31_008760 [Mortierella sp. GBA43]
MQAQCPGAMRDRSYLLKRAFQDVSYKVIKERTGGQATCRKGASKVTTKAQDQPLQRDNRHSLGAESHGQSLSQSTVSNVTVGNELEDQNYDIAFADLSSNESTFSDFVFSSDKEDTVD